MTILHIPKAITERHYPAHEFSKGVPDPSHPVPSHLRAADAMWAERAKFANRLYAVRDVEGFDLFVPEWVRENEEFIFMLDEPRAQARAALWKFAPHKVQR